MQVNYNHNIYDAIVDSMITVRNKSLIYDVKRPKIKSYIRKIVSNFLYNNTIDLQNIKKF